MTCNHCARRVEDALGALADTRVDHVDSATGEAILTVASWMHPDTYGDAVSSAGYELKAVLVENGITVPVAGMHCDNCVRKVTTALEASGRRRERCRFTGRWRGLVSGGPRLDALVCAIEDTGYSVPGSASGETKIRQPDLRLNPRLNRQRAYSSISTGCPARAVFPPSSLPFCRARVWLRPRLIMLISPRG
ncbi:MAG: hypothetical protein U5O39_09795 [Gammaproteobacteria bacterium]|nr:hypothetical protein [Gammaproteobacteria bacterium]